MHLQHHQVLESRLKPLDVIISFPLKNSVLFSSHCIYLLSCKSGMLNAPNVCVVCVSGARDWVSVREAAECVFYLVLLGGHTGSIVFSRRSFLLSVVSPDSALLAPPMIPLTSRLCLPVRLLPNIGFVLKFPLKIYSVKRQRAKNRAKKRGECFLFKSVFGTREAIEEAKVMPSGLGMPFFFVSCWIKKATFSRRARSINPLPASLK